MDAGGDFRFVGIASVALVEVDGSCSCSCSCFRLGLDLGFELFCGETFLVRARAAVGFDG